MIVICTGCQARFRVADEKVGPRGARVRCSRCHTVFVVKREPAQAPPPAPRLDLDLTPGPRGTAGPGRPAPAPATVIPFPATVSQPRPPPPDPFAAAGLEAFGEPAPAGDDPFARVAGPGPALAPAPPAPALDADDPFASAGRAPAFGGPSTGTTGAHSLPVTDLSQLLGGPAPAARPTAVAPAPLAPAALEASDPFAPQPAREPELGFEPGLVAPQLAAEPQRGGAPQLATEPRSGAEPQLGAEPDLGFELPAAAPAGAPEPGPGAGPLGGDLALEEHSGARQQTPFADPADVVMSGEPGPVSFDGAAFEAGSLGALSGPDESLSLATDSTPGPASVPPPVPAQPSNPPEPASRGPAGAAPATPAEDVEEDDRRRAGLARPDASTVHRLRSAAVNALALVALLAIALGFRVVLRGEAALGPAALRPSTLLRALRGSEPGANVFEMSGVRTRVYPQSAGGALLLVRGELVSRAPGPVGPVRVEAELVRDGQVVARSDARAGAIPTPEEVDGARDAAALESLGAALRKRAPARVAPGERLAFVVIMGEAPADVGGTSVRVRVEPDPGSP